MVLRRVAVDIVDRGLDPRLPHSRLDKQGRLIDTRPRTGEVIVDMQQEAVMNDDLLSGDLLTENVEDTIEVKKIKKPGRKPKHS